MVDREKVKVVGILGVVRMVFGLGLDFLGWCVLLGDVCFWEGEKVMVMGL